MSEWKEFAITDFAEILNQRRVPLSAMQRAKRKGEFPYFGASGIIDYVDDYLFEGEHVLISEDGENLKSRQTPIAFKADGKFWVNNHAHILKGKKDFHNKLIIYYLQNLDLHPYITGAVQPKLSKGSLLQIPFHLPEDEFEQRAIASVLSSLDDKIDLLHRQNQTLEQMAETLFRQWFVEDPNPEWEERPLSEFGQIICGKTPSKKKPEYFDGEYPFIKIPDMHGKTFVFDTQDSLSEEGFLSQEKKALPAKSINVSCIATVGLVTMNAFPSQTNQQINSIITTDEYRYYLYCEMKNSYDLLHAMASGGTATLNLNTGNFSKIPVLQPDEETIDKFNEIVSPIFDKIFEKQTQIRTLTALRDTLLPKLMSGEVRV